MISEIIFNRQNGPDKIRVRESHDDGINPPHIRSYDYALDADVDTLLAQHATQITEQLGEQEAEQASEDDTGIVTGDFASIELKALAYLRKAYSIEDPYQAYIRFDKFNDFRVSKGWSLTQVVAGLTSVGLTQDEWDSMLARYTYLSNAQRVTAMENYQLVLSGDIYA